MPNSGDIWRIDLGSPIGSEAGFVRPVVIVTAQAILSRTPTVVQGVPVTSIRRDWPTEVDLDPDPQSGLDEPSAAQCHHIRSFSTERLVDRVGNVGPAALSQIRELLSDLLDL